MTINRIQQSRTITRDLAGAAACGFAVVILVLALLWRDPLLFWNDDYQLSILPVFADVARSWSEGNLPLLSPYSWVCGNLAGEFQYGTFSIFVNAAVVAIWKFPLTFAQQAAALSTVHLFVLAAGGHMLARGRGIASPLAAMVGIVAALNGWIVCWGATDWFGALGAFAWLPCAWWGLERALDPARGRWRFIYPAPFVYLLVTGGFPYTILMLALITAWLAVRSVAETRSLRGVFHLALGSALGFGLAAPAWLALFSYVHGSAREAQDAASHFQWLVPPAALPGFIMPAWTVKWADFSTRMMPHTAAEMANGLVAPAAVIAAFFALPRTFLKRAPWDLALAAVVLVISMLPTANMFRWSFRWLPLLHVAIALCGAQAMQLTQEDARRWLRPSIVGLSALVIAVAAMSLLGTEGVYGARLSWSMLGVAAVWVALDTFAANGAIRPWTPASITALMLLATFLCMPANCGVPRYELPQTLNASAPLAPDRVYLSVYPAPENAYRIGVYNGPVGRVIRPGSTSMWGGLSLINGYSPIRPAGVARQMNFGIHGEIDFEVARRLLATGGDRGGELEQLGVDGIIIARDFIPPPTPTDEWERVYSDAEGDVYHRRDAPLPRVRVFSQQEAGSVASLPDVRIVSESRNAVEVDLAGAGATAPAAVVFTRPYFDGYRATLNGKRLPVRAERGAMPVVHLPANANGRLALVYRPRWLILGGIAAAISLVILGVGTALMVRDGRASAS